VADVRAAGPLRTAIDHSAFFTNSELELAYQRTRAAGATSIKIVLPWRDIAPASPDDFEPTDPGDAKYSWDRFDDEVRLAVAAGLEPFVTIDEAPSWAERSSGGRAGTNSPDPVQLGYFAEAAARRYSGNFKGLPRVRRFEAWNEPNASFFLTPQKQGTRFLAAELYRKMVNSFSAAVHGVHADNEVIAGATYPFIANRPGAQAVGPLQFMRALFCLDTRLRPIGGCGEPVRFDIWSHHPYTSGGPTHRAADPNAVSIRELPRMRRVLDAAARTGRAISPHPIPFWVSEFSWDSNPPDPGGVPTGLHARWVAEALYRMWRSGVSLVTWFKLRDDGPSGGKRNSQIFQSGLYFRCWSLACDTPKPALRAFRYPFVAIRSGRRVYVWGRIPSGKGGTVIVQQRVGKRWRRLRRLSTNEYGIFSRRIPTRRRGGLRAVLADGSDVSVAFSLVRPPDRPVNPFG